MNEIITVDTIQQCNKLLHEETLYPLVSVASLQNLKEGSLLQMSFYAVLMRMHTKNILCGWMPCDYSDGTVVFLAPGQLLPVKGCGTGFAEPCLLLSFHPDFIKNTTLGKHFGDYSFFHYRQNEALHVSAREKRVLQNAVESIDDELRWGIDEYSKTLLLNKIELFLNYCARFYKRQFITRHEVNCDLVGRVDKLTHNYFLTHQVLTKGLPSAKYCARMLNLSPAYFEDLLRHETGKNIAEYIQLKRVSIAQEQLRRTDKSVAAIAEELGYTSPQFFCRLFKKLTGLTPSEYRLPG